MDEIADTPLAFQGKFLRVLQEGEVKLVGGNRSIKVNVRVISASHQSLIVLIHNQAFRSDLHYRLALGCSYFEKSARRYSSSRPSFPQSVLSEK